MILAGIHRDSTLSLVAGLATLALAVTLVLLGLAGGWRMLVVAAGGMLFVGAAVASGNPRLFTLWALMFAIPMALSKHFDEIFFQGGGEQSFRVELYDPFVLILLLYQLNDQFRHRVAGMRVPPITWLWISIMVMGTIDVAQGPWRTAGAHELVRMFKVMVMFVVLVNEFVSPQRILSCVVPLGIGVLIQAAVGFAQYFKGDLLGLEILGETTARTIENLAYTSVEGVHVFRPSGLLLHANIYGIYLASMLPILIAVFLRARQLLLQAFLVLCIVAGMGGLLLSQSRAAWVAFAIAFAVLLLIMLMHRRLSRQVLLPAIGAATAVFCMLLVFSEQILRRLFASKDDATVGREVFMSDFFKLISDHWFTGVGMNSYVYEVVPYLSFSVDIYKGWIPPVHNIYFLWWGELGILGLALHLLIWLHVCWIGIRNLACRDELLYALNAAGLAVNCALIFDGFFSFSLRVNQPQRIFFLVAAIIYATHYLHLRARRAAAGVARR